MALGEDPDRPGLLGTPDRFARSWLEFMNYAPGSCDTTFDPVGENQLVVVQGIRVWSYCEHHLLPFYCDLDIGYIARDRVLGLSKFARIAHRHAHRLQIQERLVQQIADEICDITGSPDVGVIARGVHTCMVMRGIRTDGVMVSRVLRGAFEKNRVKQEFLTLAGG